LKGKTPLLLLIVIIAIAVVIILLETLEDTVIEGGSFAGTRVAIIWNAIIALTQGVTSAVSSWG
jgi:hypothetical protein